ncbi:MarR family transcriptional regulator [Desulfosporosinus sp. PR]|uniref:MarR family winged helix-turn-helix transcriptional regulator n=1 Tax=Candidatus Desulfosporosinus nitrosoreducens TaxID=3401928 RepID=UPI0027F6070C|nr:MarR family transcriptional regulator [Desulfosporosinus sp. PR]MDQ7093621.1 MarR family transcriptional regulator [Desulfosporosinus sp. PR]
MNRASIGVKIKMIDIGFDRLSNQMLKPYDLTSTQFKVLLYLLKRKSEITKQIDLEKHFGLTNPTVTGILNNLEKSGFVKREVNEQDVRSKKIRLCQNVLQLESELTAIAVSIEKKLTQGLSKEEIESTLSVLEKIFANLNQ